MVSLVYHERPPETAPETAPEKAKGYFVCMIITPAQSSGGGSF